MTITFIDNARKDDTMIMFSKKDVGCYISEHEGWRGVALVVLLAERLGYPLSEDDDREVVAYLRGEDASDAIFDIHDETEAWLNANVRPGGTCWYWNDGDFGLWEDDNEPMDDDQGAPGDVW